LRTFVWVQTTSLPRNRFIMNGVWQHCY